MAKPLSLADRIALAKKENENQGDRDQEKKLVNSLAKERDTGSNKGPVSSIQSRSSKGPVRVQTVSSKGPDTVQSGSGLDPVSSIGSSIQSGSGLGPVSSIGSSIQSGSTIEKIILAPQQQRVYEWFLKNGFSGHFNKGIISRRINVSIPTIKKSITKLKEISLIRIGAYDPVSRRQEYSLSTEKKVKLILTENQENMQGPVSNIGSSIQSGSNLGPVSNIGSSQGPVSTSPNKIDRLIFLNKLSIPESLVGERLTHQKIIDFDKKLKLEKNWEPTEKEWQDNILFEAYLFENKKTEKPWGHLKHCMLNSTGLEKPDGFEFPEERRARIARENADAKHKALEELEQIQAEERVLADKQAIMEFLADKDAVASAIEEIKQTDKVLGTKLVMAIKLFEKSSRITTQLENRLKRWMRTE